MPTLIIHHKGAYNLYTTVADGPCFTSALDLGQINQVVRVSGGQRAIDELPERIRRAQATGCSSIHGETLAECIAGNRAGPGETEVPYDDFIAKYLTLP